jgi:hypothetical protein
MDQRGEFNDPGGYWESNKHARISDCAASKLCEETRGTVNVSSSDLRKCKFLDIAAGRHKYRIYILFVNNRNTLVEGAIGNLTTTRLEAAEQDKLTILMRQYETSGVGGRFEDWLKTADPALYRKLYG